MFYLQAAQFAPAHPPQPEGGIMKKKPAKAAKKSPKKGK